MKKTKREINDEETAWKAINRAAAEAIKNECFGGNFPEKLYGIGRGSGYTYSVIEYTLTDEALEKETAERAWNRPHTIAMKVLEEIAAKHNYTADNVMIYVTYGNMSRAILVREILDGEKFTIDRATMEQRAVELTEKYTLKPGEIRCEYCHEPRPADKISEAKIWINHGTVFENFCNDKPCASYRQMGAEG